MKELTKERIAEECFSGEERVTGEEAEIAYKKITADLTKEKDIEK